MTFSMILLFNWWEKEKKKRIIFLVVVLIHFWCMAHNTRDPWLDIYNSQCTIGGSATNSHDLTDLQLVVENQDGKNHSKRDLFCPTYYNYL